MDDILKRYSDLRKRFLVPVAKELRKLLELYLQEQPRIDRISVRAKSPQRFVDKANKTVDGRTKYITPFSDIQDMIGARVITFYAADVDQIADTLQLYFQPIEGKRIVPESADKFGYEGQHFIFSLPTDVIPDSAMDEDAPQFFEMQVKTLFQHAWSEASHDLAYKPDKPLLDSHQRMVAYAAAQAWGGDRVFDELRRELDQK